MDPDFVSKPEQTGVFGLTDCSLYFERRGISGTENVVLIIGAFATLRRFDQLADHLASSGFNVLTYDHRGIGKSTVIDKRKAQSSTMLAKDCVLLLDHVFGSSSKIHVYGASMGGCVAQHVALELQKQNRLDSVYFAVTSRGWYFQLNLWQRVWKWIVQYLLVKREPADMVGSLLPKYFSQEHLQSKDGHGVTMEERWVKKCTEEYCKWYCFADVDICASQISAFTSHYLSEDSLRPLRDVFCTVHIAENDELMPVAKQRDLARILQARTVVFKSGHSVGTQGELDLFFHAVLKHLRRT